MSKAMLDKERVLTWGPATVLCRVGEIANPPPLTDMGSDNQAKQVRANVVYLWACLERPHPWETPDALAAWFDAHPGKIKPAVLALFQTVNEGLSQKKDPAATSAPLPALNSG